MAIECKHGQLARSCEICELEAENVRLRAENERLSSVLQQINDWCWTDDGAHALPCEPPWAKAMQSALDAAGGGIER